MIRNAVFASLIALGAAGAAQAADPGPRLVNVNGSQEVVYGSQPAGNVVGGAFASISGGGDNLVYRAAPGARTEASTGLVARLENVNGDQRVLYGPATPATSSTLLAVR
jgi:hypothetical protein